MEQELCGQLKGYFRLASAVVFRSFVLPQPYNFKTRIQEYNYYWKLKEAKRNNIKLADSKLLKMWCDCADIDYSKLKEAIIKHNILE